MELSATRTQSPSEALSTAIVGIFKEYVGRGPTRARVLIVENVVIATLSDTLTKAERSLVASGDGETVRSTRRLFQEAMREDLVRAVELVVGRKVVAFLSDNHLDPDLAAEIFVLEPPAPKAPV